MFVYTVNLPFIYRLPALSKLSQIEGKGQIKQNWSKKIVT